MAVKTGEDQCSMPASYLPDFIMPVKRLSIGLTRVWNYQGCFYEIGFIS